MSAVPDHESALARAEEAAGAGDLEAAERLLRDALATQEASLGPLHPDVANTVNNLAVVCERLAKFDDAEKGYRRAHAIAVASLTPRHPFVATSLKNLVDFCTSRDSPLWTPPAAVAATHAAVPAPDRSPAPSPPSDAAPEVPARPVTSGLPRRRLVPRLTGVAALAAMVVVGAIVAMQSLEEDGASGAPIDPSTRQSTQTPAAAAPPARGAPSSGAPSQPAAAERRRAAAAPSAGSTPSAAPAAPLASRAAAISDDGPATAAASVSEAPPAGVTVMRAQLCRELARQGSPDWECTAPGGAPSAGVFHYYTRVRAGADTTIQHRWYREDRLHQTITLRVRASGAGGYRTYSRTTVSPDRAGNWKVEVRAADGSLLGDASFTVR